MRSCVIIHPLHLELETAKLYIAPYDFDNIDMPHDPA
jgi:hypothetical protein